MNKKSAEYWMVAVSVMLGVFVVPFYDGIIELLKIELLPLTKVVASVIVIAFLFAVLTIILHSKK